MVQLSAKHFLLLSPLLLTACGGDDSDISEGEPTPRSAETVFVNLVSDTTDGMLNFDIMESEASINSVTSVAFQDVSGQETINWDATDPGMGYFDFSAQNANTGTTVIEPTAKEIPDNTDFYSIAMGSEQPINDDYAAQFVLLERNSSELSDGTAEFTIVHAIANLNFGINAYICRGTTEIAAIKNAFYRDYKISGEYIPQAEDRLVVSKISANANCINKIGAAYDAPLDVPADTRQLIFISADQNDDNQVHIVVDQEYPNLN
ncbi:hypothetical protein [Motilimonas pumila]|uniref:DUF4397 domain-containing protein n=1 Tax=Motilimonas pumila TaxID=2303987 RepID=A0A418YHT6_9GAMM|nr:hypothetical protein [Motilimonas pumila]RJG49950.1 hypothetical protein D1Z90_04715 [Motilimonas pumila]